MIPICTTHNRPAAHAQNTDTCVIVNLVVVEPDKEAAADELAAQISTWLYGSREALDMDQIIDAAIPGRRWAEEE